MRILYLYLFFLVGVVINANGQDFLPRVVNFTPKDYGDLLTPENYSITQDEKGLLYFGNSNCILVYDGSQWETISIEGISGVTSLRYNQGKIFCGGSNEFGYLSPDSKGKLTYHSLSDSISSNFSTIWRIHSIDEQIYFQAREGIFIYDGNSIKSILPETSFHLSFSIDNKLFVRQREIGIMEVKNGQMDVAIPGDDLYGIFDILHGENSNEYLLVTQEFGLWIYDETKNGKLEPASADSCPSIRYKNIIGGVELEGGLYGLYSISEGLFIVDNHGRLKDNITRKSGLRSDEIKNAFVDVHENLWLATAGGICQLNDNSPISYYQEPSGIIGNVQSITEFKGRKYVGTSLGLYKESDEGHFHFQNTSIHGQTWTLTGIDTSILFVGTSEGLFASSDGKNFKFIDKSNCNALYYDDQNNFLISAGKNGIKIFDGYSSWQLIQDFSAGLGGVTRIVKHPKTNDYWIGTLSVGAIRVLFDGFTFSMDVFGSDAGLHHGALITPFVADSEVYFGTPYDLLRFVHEEEIKKDLSEEEKQNPDYYRGYFSESNIFGAKPGHNYQQFLFAGDLTFACIDNNIVLYVGENKYDKDFKSVDIGRINQFELIGDQLYIGAAEGFLVVDVQKLLWRIDNAAPNTFAAVIRKVNYKDSTLFYGFGSSPERNEVAYRRNNITVDYSASFYEGTHKPLFSWRLLGDNDEWSKWTESTRAEFSNLHEGKYEFQVKAKNVFEEESSVSVYRFLVLTPWFRTTWAFIGYVIFLILIVYVAIKLGQKRLKAKNIWLEGVVEERTVEIKVKNKELEHSYHEIAEQKQEITDSINYAKRIQEAILPLNDEIKQHISEYFVLFMPKDIVSGDFYWFYHIGDESVFVCADCTGHGVPGAFMSMVGSDKLNRAVIEEKNTDPAKILSHLNRGIKMALKQNEDDVEATRDGMDASIVSLDLKNRKLRFAGAHRPLFMIRNGELTETKATKVAVGGFTPDNQEFELNNFDLEKDDCFYMTSDGYPDQFGGERGKKFKLKAFKDLLIDIHQLPMANQKEILTETIQSWMGSEYEQIDDICVIGIKIA